MTQDTQLSSLENIERCLYVSGTWLVVVVIRPNRNSTIRSNAMSKMCSRPQKTELKSIGCVRLDSLFQLLKG
jgi:hypothetical protein